MKTLAVFMAVLLYSVTLSSQERITLLFVGDLMQHQAQIDAARVSEGKYDYSSCFSLIKEQISQADLAIGNLEVTLGGRPYRGYPMFSAPDEYLQAIKDAGFDILLTANNHCLDRGKKGMERTIQLLDSSGIRYAGTYKNLSERRQRYPLFINRNGFRIALLNYTYGTNGIKATSPNIVNYIDKNTILQDIQSAKARQPDAIIACMHWGEEYQSLPNREQRELANWLLQQGVTHIIGSHPHVIQPMELRTNGTEQHIIVYSLGNFISNMSKANTCSWRNILSPNPSVPLTPVRVRRLYQTPILCLFHTVVFPIVDIIWSGPAGRNLLKKKITFFILPVFLQNI